VTVVECITEGARFEHFTVLVDGERLTPDESLKVWRHSPSGFSWGYGGSGPAQLALAILLACDIEPEDAVRVHQKFKRQFIETLPQDSGWRFEVDVPTWVAKTIANDE
jgi:Family of unknown function (DUF6166)